MSGEGMFLIESVKSHPGTRNPVEVISQWRNPCVRPSERDIPSTNHPTELVTGETWKLPDGTWVTVGITKQAKEQLGPLYGLHREFLEVSANLRGQVEGLKIIVEDYETKESKRKALGFFGRLRASFFWCLEAIWPK